MLDPLKYIAHYPAQIQHQAKRLIEEGKLGAYLQQQYPDTFNHPHSIQSDKALYAYVNDLKNSYLGKVGTLTKVSYNSKLSVLKNALGIHTHQSRVQGSKLKAHNSITVASIFQEAPLEFLQMIVVHELAHFKVSDHNKAFYQLCCHMQTDYHQIELHTRLWLLLRELEKNES
ncbi:YgjP-like metallopeptidase domain-containing protein [Psychrobacter sp.]|uniref:YgjP-like metallopeptidase domain-containing protein n=1 Tax=Psychrobacter sp. TaxID=56811 RepID=UPI0025D6E0EF|nr:YgjP-like metallopeptidase domain-containing protein [Psychrobacter sp.]